MATAKLFSRWIGFLFVASILLIVLNNVQKYDQLIYKMIRYEIAPTKASTSEHNIPSGFVFLKTHKTATETLLCILRKHRDRMNLTNQVTTYPEPYCGGYPGYFRSDLALVNNLSQNNESTRVLADVLMDHMRFNKTEVMSVMRSDVKYITILRDPIRAFESAFYFFYGSFRFPGKLFTEAPCVGQPYMQITGKLGVNFSEYIKLAENTVNDSLAWYFRSRNYQAYDLGLDPMNSSMDYIFRKIKDLNATFDLVLITDHLLESLVLLKELLRMEWQDVIPLSKNKGKYKHHIYNKEEERIVRKLNNQDLILYDYFNKTLWHKIDQYGREKMKEDVAHLRKLMREQKNQNLEKQQIFPHDVARISTPKNRVDVLMKRIHDRRGNSQNVSRETTRKIAEHMVKNFGWCPT